MIPSTARAASTPSAPHTPARRRASSLKDATLSNSRREALEDAELARRFNGGDERAFVEIMARHRHRIYLVAFATLKNHSDAEEVTQDAFIRAYRALATFRGESSLATWLHRIALNLSRNRYWYLFRRRRHATVSFDSTLGDGNPATVADLVATDTAGPAREAVASEFSELVRVCMKRLADQPRQMLTLRNTRDCSYDEIARELGINVGTVKSRVARARGRLRVLLADACSEFGQDAQPGAWFDPLRPSGRLKTICV